MRTNHAVKVRPAPAARPATVSVVVTCYNYAEYLPAAVASAVGQRDVEVEVVIVDDASSDRSLEVARELERRHAAVTVIANPRNLGAPEAFNAGLDAATGEYLVRLDADDLLTPGSLARSVAVMQALPSVGLVYGRPLHFSEDRLPAARDDARAWTVWRGRDWLAHRCADGTNVITSPEVMTRRRLLADLGGMRPLAHTHDMELWLRLSAHADVAYIRGADQAWHREHPASLSRRADPPLVILAEIDAAFSELFAALGPSYPRSIALRAAAARGVAQQAVAHARSHADRGRSPGLVDELLAFARATDPALASTASYRRFERRRRRPAGAAVRVIGLAGRLRRRLRESIRAGRWNRTGVYERVRLVRADRAPSGASEASEASEVEATEATEAPSGADATGAADAALRSLRAGSASLQ